MKGGSTRFARSPQGRWKISPNGELQYGASGKNEEANLKAPIIAVEPGAIVASLTSRQLDQNIVTTLVRLNGSWKADSRNRLVFEAERESGKNDVLTLEGAWEIDSNQQIVYRFRRTALKTKKRQEREIIFRGHWDLSSKNRLIYSLSAGNSAFRFRGAFQTKSVIAKKGELRYQIGVEAQGRRRVRTVVLFGRWIVSNDMSLLFETEFEDGRRRAFVFGGEFRLSGKDRIAVTLKHRDGAKLGMELILTRDLFGRDGNAFVRLQKNLSETRIEAGTRLVW